VSRAWSPADSGLVHAGTNPVKYYQNSATQLAPLRAVAVSVQRRSPFVFEIKGTRKRR
jgi:hypothetical protein